MKRIEIKNNNGSVLAINVPENIEEAQRHTFSQENFNVLVENPQLDKDLYPELKAGIERERQRRKEAKEGKKAKAKKEEKPAAKKSMFKKQEPKAKGKK